MRKHLLVLSLVAAPLAAQQPAATPVPTPSSVQLEAIVAVVGDAVITRFDLQEQVLVKIQRHEVDEPKTRADTLAIQREALNDMIEEELLL